MTEERGVPGIKVTSSRQISLPAKVTSCDYPLFNFPIMHHAGHSLTLLPGGPGTPASPDGPAGP